MSTHCSGVIKSGLYLNFFACFDLVEQDCEARPFILAQFSWSFWDSGNKGLQWFSAKFPPLFQGLLPIFSLHPMARDGGDDCKGPGDPGTHRRIPSSSSYEAGGSLPLHRAGALATVFLSAAHVSSWLVGVVRCEGIWEEELVASGTEHQG